MITHFREAQSDLSSLPTTADFYPNQPSHQANAITNSNAINDIAEIVTKRILESMPPLDSPVPDIPPTPTHLSQINSIQDRETALLAREHSLQTQIQELISLMSTSNTTITPKVGHHPPSGPSKSNTKPPNHRSQTNPRLYCWSHGCCAHSSSDCQHQRPGHQPTATFSNMLNGSTAKCYWLSN